MLALTALNASAQDDEGDPHGRRRGRRPASYTCDTAKHVSLAYNSFYHRHDLAGCFHLGQAILTCGKEGSIDPDKRKAMDEVLAKAKRYCSEDRVSRHDVIEYVRDAVRIIHGHATRTISSEAEQAPAQH